MSGAQQRLIFGEGTSAATWQAARQWLAMPLLTAEQLVPPESRLVVIAPHPDDEVLSCGGILQAAATLGREVLVVAVTDGEASHPGSTRWPAGSLADVRRRESANALQLLGLGDRSIHRLGFPDGGLARREQSLRVALAGLIAPGDVVIAPWRLDGHPDHEAVGRIAAKVAESVGASRFEAPIWGWHWANPDHAAFPWSRAIGFQLDEAATRRKIRAVGAFESQLSADASTGAAPILPDWALDRLVHDREVFLR